MWAAAEAPNGREPFTFSLDLSLAKLAHVAIKPVHIRGHAVILLTAILAVGSSDVLRAVAITLGLGLVCELAQATGVGHNGQLADMLPNLIGIGAGLGGLSGWIARALAFPRPYE